MGQEEIITLFPLYTSDKETAPRANTSDIDTSMYPPTVEWPSVTREEIERVIMGPEQDKVPGPCKILKRALREGLPVLLPYRKRLFSASTTVSLKKPKEYADFTIPKSKDLRNNKAWRHGTYNRTRMIQSVHARYCNIASPSMTEEQEPKPRAG
ncbi:MAG: hypothetical protein LQ348_005314 [Seirophora lacunosa]|nr:MAG: hypothetical protein LQ348_005314 [Seirophora lacunosa]